MLIFINFEAGLTTSFAEGSPTQVTDRYRLKKALPVEMVNIQEVKTSPKPAPFSVNLSIIILLLIIV